MTVRTTDARQNPQIIVRDPRGNVTKVINIGDLQVGFAGGPSSLVLTGGLEVATNVVQLSVTNPNYTLQLEDLVVCVNSPTSQANINLPTIPLAGKLYIIKDIAGTAQTFPISLIPEPGITIDGDASSVIDDNYGSFFIIWNGSEWVTIARGGSGGIYAPSNASYITINNESGLANERKLISTTGTIEIIDNGPNSSVTIDLTTSGVAAGVYTTANVTVDTYGRVTAITNGVVPSAAAPYVTITSDPSLSAERALTPGTGLGLIDNGANSTVVLFIKDNIVAALTGAHFSGPLNAGGGLTGSLQQVSPGFPYLLSGPGITISTSSFGQIAISSSFVQVSVTGTFRDVGSSFITTASVAIDSQNRQVSQIGSDVFFFASGSTNSTGPTDPNRHVAVFGGDVFSSGTVASTGGFTGSLTQTSTGQSYLVGAGGVTVTSGSNGQVTITGVAAAGVFVDNQSIPIAALPFQTLNFVGPGVSVTNAGSSATISVNTGGGTQVFSGAFAVYDGYCTGSLTWNATSWTDFSTVPGNFVDTNLTYVSRSAATFTVAQTGVYYWNSVFNFAGGTEYVGFRLSGSNGTILQQTSFDNNASAVTDARMEGVITLLSGSSFNLQYIVKSGSSATWSVNDPIGGENMRTGHVSMFLIPSGSTTTYNITGQAGTQGFQQANYQVVTSSLQWFLPLSASFVGEPNLTASISTAGSPVMIMATLNLTAFTDQAVGAITLFRDGFNLGHPSYGLQTFGPIVQTYNMPGTIWWVDTPASGVHNYSVAAYAMSSSVVALAAQGVGPSSLMMWEMKGANVATSVLTTPATISSTGFTQVPNLTASLFVNRGPVMVWTNTNFLNPVASKFGEIALFRGASTLGNILQIGETVSAGESVPINACILDASPTAGTTNTYSVQALNGDSNQGKISGRFSYSQLVAWELTDINYRYASTTSGPSAGSSWTDIIGTTEPIVTRGRPVLVMSNIVNKANGATDRTAYNLARNGVSNVLANGTKGMQLVDGENLSTFVKPASLGWIDVVPSGYYTYNAVGQNISGSGGPDSGTVADLFIYELDAGAATVIVGGWFDIGNTLVTTASVVIDSNLNVLGNTTTVENLNVLGTLNYANAINPSVTGTWKDTGVSYTTTSSVAIDSQGRAPANIGSDVYFFVSGSVFDTGASDPNRHVAVFGGKLRVSGNIRAEQGFTGSLTTLDGLTSFIAGAGGVTVITASNGQIIISSSIPVFTSSGGGSGETVWTDGGNRAYSTGSISVDSQGRFANGIGSDIFVFFSGSVGSTGPTDPNRHVAVFGGDIVVSGSGVFNSGLSGSLTKLTSGISYLVPGTNVSITSQSNGQVVISSTTATDFVWVDGNGKTYTTSSVSFDPRAQFASHYGTDVYFYVSGSIAKTGQATTPTDPNRHIIVFGGDMLVSGSGLFTAGLSGSIQQTTSGISYLAAGSNITILSQSNGQIVISAPSAATTAGEGISIVAGTIATNLSASTGILLLSGTGNQVNVYNTKTGDDKAQYVTLASTSSLPNASVLAAGEGLSLAGSTLSINLAPGSGVSFTSGSGNQVIVNASGGGAGSTVWIDGGTETYTTSSVSIDPRAQFAPQQGTDIQFWVSGSVGNTTPTDPNRHVVAFGGDQVVSGTGFFLSGLSASLTRLPSGVSFLVPGNNVSIVTASNGQILISAPTNNVWIDDGNKTYTTSSVSIDSQGRDASGIGTDVFFFVSGSISSSGPTDPNRHIALFGGRILASGAFHALGGFTGSLTEINNGTSYLVGGTNISVVTSSAGQVVVSNSITAGRGLNLNGSVFSLDVLAGANIIITSGSGNQITITSTGGGGTGGSVWVDGGNESFTTSSISIDPQGNYANHYGTDIQFWISGSIANQGGASSGTDPNRHISVFGGDVLSSGSITALGGFTGSLTQTTSGVSYLAGGGSVTVSSQSNGQVLISAPQAFGISTGYPLANWAMVTASNAYQTVSGSGFQNVPGMSVTMTTSGSPILLMVQADWVAITANAQASFALTRNGTQLGGDAVYGMQYLGPKPQSYSDQASLLFVDFQPAGTYTYKFTANGIDGTGSLGAFGVSMPALMAFEMVNANVVTGSTTAQFTIGGSYTSPSGMAVSITPVKNPVLVMALTNTTFTNSQDFTENTLFKNGSNMGPGVGLNVVAENTAGATRCVMTSLLDLTPTYGTSTTYAFEAQIGSATTPTINKHGQLSTIIAWELTDFNYKYASTTAGNSLGGAFADIMGTSPISTLTTRGRPVLLIANANFNPNSGPGRGAYSFARNQSTLATGSNGMIVADGEGINSDNTIASLMWIDNVSAGTYQYQLFATAVSGSGQIGESGQPTNLFMYELDAGFAQGLAFAGWLDKGNKLVSSASVAVDGRYGVPGTFNIGTDSFLWVSGTINVPQSNTQRKVAVFGGDSVFSGSINAIGGLTGSLTQLSSGISYLAQGGGVVITSQSNGQIRIAASLTTATGEGLSNDGNTMYINIAPGPGLSITSGSGNQIILTNTAGGFSGTLGVMVSGSTFPLPNNPYVGLNFTGSVSVSDAGNGIAQIFVPTPTVWLDGGNKAYTTSSISHDSQNKFASQHGSDIFFYVSGSVTASSPTDPNRHVAVFGGDTVYSGSQLALGGLTGSLQQTTSGVSYLAGGTNITVTTQSNGQVVIASTAAPTAGEGVSIVAGVISTNVTVGTGLLFTSGSGTQLNLFNSKPGDDKASYIVSATTSSLPNATLLGAGEGISVSGATVSANLKANTGILLTSGSGNQINVFNTKTGDDQAQYIVAATTASLPNATLLAAGEGLSVSGATLSLNIAAGTGVSIVSGSGNQITISAGSGGGGSVWVDGNNKSYTTSSISIDPRAQYASQQGSDIQFWVSGSIAKTGQATTPTDPNRHVAVFGGDVYVSGSLFVKTGLTGSRTQTAAGLSAFVAGSNITITSGSSTDQVVISTPVTQATAGEGLSVAGSALSLNLAAGTGITFASGSGNQVIINSSGGGGGSGGSVWVDVGNTSYTTSSISIDSGARLASSIGSDVFFFASGSQNVTSGPNRHVTVFGGDTVHSGTAFFPSGLSGSLTQTTAGLSYLVGTGATTITSGSSTGQVVINTPVSYTITPGVVNANWFMVSGSNSFTVPSGFGSMPGISGTLTTIGGPVLVQVNANWTSLSAGAAAAFTLTRNGTNIGHPNYGLYTAGPRISTWQANVSFFYFDVVGAGTYTYALQANALSGSSAINQDMAVGPTAIFAFELKNANYVYASSSVTTTVATSGFLPITGLSASFVPVKNPVVAMYMTSNTITNATDWGATTLVRGATDLGASSGQGLQAFVGETANETLPCLVVEIDQSPTFGSTNTYTVKGKFGSVSTTFGKNFAWQQLLVFELTDVNFKVIQTTAGNATGASYADLIPTTPLTTLVTRGRPVWLLANGCYNSTSTTGRAAFTFFRNGSAFGNAKGLNLSDCEGGSSFNHPASLMWIDNPPAGSYQYQYAGLNVSGSGQIGETSMQTTLFMYEIDPGFQVGASFAGWFDTGNNLISTASISIDKGLTPTKTIGSDVYLWVSGSIAKTGASTTPTDPNRHIAVFGGDTVFSGSIATLGGISGSLQNTNAGVSYLAAGTNISVTTQSNGQVLISAAVTSVGGAGSVWVDGGTRAYTTGSISIDPTATYANQHGTDIWFYVSGSVAKTGQSSTPTDPNRHVAVFAGDTVYSGSQLALGGITGSIQQTTSGLSYLAAGTGITITTQSNGQILFSGVGAAGSSNVWTDGGNKSYTTSSISIDPRGNLTTAIGSDIVFYVSGSASSSNLSPSNPNRHMAVFGGDVFISGALYQKGNASGLAVNRPNPAGTGNFYYCTDVPVAYFDNPNSVTWQGFTVSYVPTPPTTSSYTAVGSINMTQLADVVSIAGTALNANAAAVLAANGGLGVSGIWAVTLMCTFNPVVNQGQPAVGVCVSNGTVSATSLVFGASIGGPGGSNGTVLAADEWTLNSTRVANSYGVTDPPLSFTYGNGKMNLRLVADGTNLHYQISADGYHWNDFFTGATPTGMTNYGVYITNQPTNAAASYLRALIYANYVSTPLSYSITAATNASPSVITIGAHSILPGDIVAIHGVVGAVGLNSGTGSTTTAGGWIVTAVTSTTITTTVNTPGAYTSGGTVVLLTR